MKVIKTCSCRVCWKACKSKHAAFKAANRRFRHQGKRHPGEIAPVSTGYPG